MAFSVDSVTPPGMSKLVNARTFLSFRDAALGDIAMSAVQVVVHRLRAASDPTVDGAVFVAALRTVEACLQLLVDGVGAPPQSQDAVFTNPELPAVLWAARAAPEAEEVALNCLAAAPRLPMLRRGGAASAVLPAFVLAVLQGVTDTQRQAAAAGVYPTDSQMQALGEIVRAVCTAHSLTEIPSRDWVLAFGALSSHACNTAGHFPQTLDQLPEVWAAVTKAAKEPLQQQCSEWMPAFVAARAKQCADGTAEDAEQIGEADGAALRRCSIAALPCLVSQHFGGQGAAAVWALTCSAALLPHATQRAVADGVNAAAFVSAGEEVAACALQFWTRHLLTLGGEEAEIQEALRRFMPLLSAALHRDLQSPLCRNGVKALAAMAAHGDVGPVLALLPGVVDDLVSDARITAAALRLAAGPAKRPNPARLLTEWRRVAAELMLLWAAETGSDPDLRLTVGSVLDRLSRGHNAELALRELRGTYAAVTSEWEELTLLCGAHLDAAAGSSEEGGCGRALLRLVAEFSRGCGRIPRGPLAAAVADVVAKAVGGWVTRRAGLLAEGSSDWAGLWKCICPCMHALAGVIGGGYFDVTTAAQREPGGAAAACLQAATCLLRSTGPEPLRYPKVRAAHHRLAAAFATSGGRDAASWRLQSAGPDFVAAVAAAVEPALDATASERDIDNAIYAAQALGGIAQAARQAGTAPDQMAASAFTRFLLSGLAVAQQSLRATVWRAMLPMCTAAPSCVRLSVAGLLSDAPADSAWRSKSEAVALAMSGLLYADEGPQRDVQWVRHCALLTDVVSLQE
eukprot:TRINITY_DN20173_c0_g1_i1.p1 TRINITY_DN20173_c0_g1~~TRINITY_DN20173_c0_g1_i1.p1  ORF type:complete len:799 (+),score=201.46 TRINITY_DN20173_c0_g1_i1:544-2940(+)